MFKNWKISIERFSKNLKACQDWAQGITTQMLDQLNSDGAIQVEKLIPEGHERREAALKLVSEWKALLEKAKAENTIEVTKGQLLVLGAQLTAIAHEGKHTFGDYLDTFLTIFRCKKQG